MYIYIYMPRPCAASLEIYKAGLASENMRFSYENSQYLVLELSRPEINTQYFIEEFDKKIIICRQMAKTSISAHGAASYLLMELPRP